MPFPDGSGMSGDPFTAVQQANAAALSDAGAPAGAGGGAWPAGLAPQDDRENLAAMEGMPTYLTSPSSFVPNPADRDPNGGVHLAHPSETGRLPDEAFAPASAPPGAVLSSGAPSEGGGTSTGVGEAPVAAPGVPVASSGLALAEQTKLKCPKCDTVQAASDKKCINCGHDLAQARKAKFANLSTERAAILYQHLAQPLNSFNDPGEVEDGLLWKVACKSGTLALSPGPGQTDAETPLVLSGQLFREMKESFDEKAFPHVTVPESHANLAVENTGYVREVDILTRAQIDTDPRISDKAREVLADDPDDTEYLLCGVEFTEPGIKEKAKNGSIPDVSIGVKFGYRNKTTGKLYKSAFEHLALTPVPWRDGLPAFGLSQQGAIFDQELVPESVDVYTDELDMAVPSQDKRDKAAASGNALPDGSFPINNVEDLKKAIKAVGRASDVDKAKAHIRKRAKALNAEHLLGDSLSMSIAARVKSDGGEYEWDMKNIDPPQIRKDAETALALVGEGGCLDLPLGVQVSKYRQYFIVRSDYDKIAGIAENATDAIDQAMDALRDRYEERRANSSNEIAMPAREALPPWPGGPNADEIDAGEDAKLSVPAGNTLPNEDDHETLVERTEADADALSLSQRTAHEDTEDPMPTRTVEDLLAEGQAEREAQAARIADLESQLSLSTSTTHTLSDQVHRDNVSKRAAALQKAGIAPALCLAAKTVWLADAPHKRPAGDGLNLSIQVPAKGEDGATTMAERQFKTASDVVEFMLSAVPTENAEVVAQMAAIHENLDLSASTVDAPPTESDKIKALDEWEKSEHPERFDSEGKRL